jgi:hypothetical protein
MMLIFIFIVIFSVLLYVENVLMGTTTSVYDCEIGSASRLDRVNSMSRQEFFTRLLPFVLFSLGVPLSLTNLFDGLALILLSGLLYFGSRK